MGWSPSSWLLAQDSHFAWGLALAFGTAAFHLSWIWIAILLILELIFKEGIFDQVVEKNPLFWDGFVDWLFYILGSLVGIALLMFI